LCDLIGNRARLQSPGAQRHFAQALHFARTLGGRAAKCSIFRRYQPGGGMENTMPVSVCAKVRLSPQAWTIDTSRRHGQI
jgi:hypothetical protein